MALGAHSLSRVHGRHHLSPSGLTECEKRRDQGLDPFPFKRLLGPHANRTAPFPRGLWALPAESGFPGTSNISVTWQLVRTLNSWASPQPCALCVLLYDGQSGVATRRDTGRLRKTKFINTHSF